MKLKTLFLPNAGDARIALALLILRLFIGIAFIQHGSGKLTHPAEFAAEFGIPVWLAFVTMFTQLTSGILLIIGATTRLAALAIAGTMITATNFLNQRGEPFINPAGHGWSKFGVLFDRRNLPGVERRRILVSGRLAVWPQRFQRCNRGDANALAAKPGN